MLGTQDHISYFFDYDTTALFGTTTPTLANPQQRILNSTNVKQLTSYIKLVYDYRKLRNLSTGECTVSVIQKAYLPQNDFLICLTENLKNEHSNSNP